MTIDEEISKAKKRADWNRSMYEATTLKDHNKHFLIQAEEAEQLAVWLEDYVRCKKAWSEVLQELEKKDDLYMRYLNNKENPYDSELFGKHIAVSNCIDIINQKLAEIEEVR